MNYSVFCDTLTALLSTRLEPEMKLCRKMIPKNNGVLLDSLLFIPASGNCSPAIYLEPLYEFYKAGSSLDAVCRSVLSCLERRLPFSSELGLCLHDPETVKELITFRLVAQKGNEAFLKNVPWIPFLDLAVIFYLHLGSEPGSQISASVHNRLAEIWNLSPRQLLSHAEINTPALFPCVLKRLADMLPPPDPKEPSKLYEPGPCSFLHLLSNQNGFYGAACILYRNAVKDFALRAGTDVIILPSSVHEVLLLPDFHFFDYDTLCRMVQDINAREVSPEEILSDHIYLYSPESDSFRIWQSPSACHTPSSGGTENPQ